MSIEIKRKIHPTKRFATTFLAKCLERGKLFTDLIGIECELSNDKIICM